MSPASRLDQVRQAWRTKPDDEPETHFDVRIADALGVSKSTVYRTRQELGLRSSRKVRR